MLEMPTYAKNFAAFRVYTATCTFGQKQESILLEIRNTALEDELLFTVVDNKDFRVGSIHELVYALPSLVALSIEHTVSLLWDGSIKASKLIEIFRPAQRLEYSSIASVQLNLIVDGKTYETSTCNTLQDAIWELQEVIGDGFDWKLITCYACQYSGQARDYALSDRKYWCYRDVPEAFAEIEVKGKYANVEARFAGSYFVDAFHACAAWKPNKVRESTTD